MNRLEHKSQMLMKLGALFGPLQKTIESPVLFNDQEVAEVVARFCNEFPRFIDDFRLFTIGQPGHDYAVQYQQMRQAVYGFQGTLVSGHSVSANLLGCLRKAQAAIDAVPVPATSVILEAGSPFTAYCRLRELCEADASTSLTWIDPYIGSSIFHRYFTAIRADVPITLVTCEPNPSHKKDQTRWNEFLDVSRLFAVERGPDRYRLIVQNSLHDRWAIFDEKRIYALGGSAKDAGQRDYFTIAKVEATDSNLAKIKQIVAGGVEFFGPAIAVHR